MRNVNSIIAAQISARVLTPPSSLQVLHLRRPALSTRLPNVCHHRVRVLVRRNGPGVVWGGQAFQRLVYAANTPGSFHVAGECTFFLTPSLISVYFSVAGHRQERHLLRGKISTRWVSCRQGASLGDDSRRYVCRFCTKEPTLLSAEPGSIVNTTQIARRADRDYLDVSPYCVHA